MSINVKATRVEDVFNSTIPGAFNIVNNPNLLDNRPYLYFICPCGCGQFISIPVNTADKGWTWNNDLENPTIIPSIRRLDGCKFHGFLTNGVWTGNLE